MAYNLSAVDIFYVTKELKVLEGAKFDKIQQIDRTLFTFRLFKDKKKQDLRVKIPEIVNITQKKYDSPQKPLAFCTFLRKHLSNTRLKEVHQHGFERIIVFEIDSQKEGELCLILEMFKPGNMILCKKVEGKLVVLNALESQKFSTRKIEARHEYSFPQNNIISKLRNPKDINSADLRVSLKESNKILGKFLATDMSLGGVYAEEMVFRAGLDKNKTELSENEAETIVRTIKIVLSEKITCTSSAPTETKEKIIFPISMKTIPSLSTFSSFCEGLDSVLFESTIIEKEEKETKGKKTKVERLVETQQNRIAELLEEAKEAQKIGEFIYEHYQDFSKLLETIKDMRKNGKSYDEIEQNLKKNKKFSKLNKAKKIAELEF